MTDTCVSLQRIRKNYIKKREHIKEVYQAKIRQLDEECAKLTQKELDEEHNAYLFHRSICQGACLKKEKDGQRQQ